MQTASIQSNAKDWSHHSCEEQVLDSPRLGQARHSTRFALTIVAPLHSYDRAQYPGRHADGNFQGSRNSLMRKESYQANLRFEALSGKYGHQKREICNCTAGEFLTASYFLLGSLSRPRLPNESFEWRRPGQCREWSRVGRGGSGTCLVPASWKDFGGI